MDSRNDALDTTRAATAPDSGNSLAPEQHSRWRTFVLPASILLSGIVISITLGTMDVHEEAQEAAAQTLVELAGVKARLESQVRSTFDVTAGIGQLLSLDGTITAASSCLRTW